MKIIKYILVTVLLVSCSANSLEPNSSNTNKKSFERKNSSEPVTQEIQIHHKYFFSDEVNTFNRTATKDLILDGTITIDFWFEENEQKEIIETLTEIDFFNLPDSIIQSASEIVEFSPDPGLKSIRIKYNEIDKTVYWTIDNSFQNEYERLKKLMLTIENFVISNEEYKKLPDPNGYYF